MRVLLLAGILGVALVLQATIFDFVRFLGVKPDLVLLVVIYYGFIHGPREGAYLGFLGGLLTDFLTGHYIGLNALSKMAAGYVVGIGKTSLYKESIIISTTVTFVGSIVGQTVYYLILLFIGIKTAPMSAIFQVIIPVAFYNAILTPIFYGRFYHSNTKGLLKMPEI
ncbi:rod shape-determining protein MreD [Peptococcaceae bacterium 1198_IL3148]